MDIIKIKDVNENILAVSDKHCWADVNDDSCTLSPGDPEEITMGEKPLSVSAGDRIGLHLNNGYHGLPEPDGIVITQFSLNENEGKEVELLEGMYKGEIQTPEESGKYYYLVHMQWSEEREGEAYYAFTITVREDS